jgi:L-serine kinase (ADP)
MSKEEICEEITFVDIHELIPHEKVSFRRVALVFIEMVLFRQFKTPLLIDSKTKTILDGHHRSYVAHRLGFKKVPCFCIDYLKDESIQVSSRRPDIFVDKREVIHMALSEKVFPEKTTKHIYKMPFFDPITINELWK